MPKTATGVDTSGSLDLAVAGRTEAACHDELAMPSTRPLPIGEYCYLAADRDLIGAGWLGQAGYHFLHHRRIWEPYTE